MAGFRMEEPLPEVGSQLENGAKVVGIFEDKYERKRVLLRTRGGVRVKHQRGDAHEYCKAIAPLLAKRIKAERKARGWTLEEFGDRLGFSTGFARERVWGIENAARSTGILMGTLFHIAEVLGVPWRDLLPAEDAVREAMQARRARAR